MRTVEIGDMPVGDGHPPRIMGVLNMSVESNYDPSTYGDADTAAEFAETELIAAGADVVDVGLQSSNPKNDWMPPGVELDRLAGALEVLDEVDAPDAYFSIETRYAEVAEEAIAGGFDMVNDVCGFADERMPEVCEEYDVPVVKMASPQSVKKPGHLKTPDEIFEALERGGFTNKTIIDPAFGGWYDERTWEDNWELFRRLREFRAFGRPILTATNREDFLGDVADRPDTEDQLAVSLAAATMEVERGADIVRTHDVPETRDVVKVAHFLGDDCVDEADPSVVPVSGVGPAELERARQVSAETAGDPEEAVTHALRVGDLEPELDDWLLRRAGEHGLFVAGDDESRLVAGTTARFRAALDGQGDGSADSTAVPGAAEVAGAIRRELARSRLS